MKDEKKLFEDLEIDILELDDVEGVPATAASSGLIKLCLTDSLSFAFNKQNYIVLCIILLIFYSDKGKKIDGKFKICCPR
ncbi:thiazolylpeptide-type bacteriocin [Streptococcus thermophilus]|nr:thiazolylpeptide-type bacteriocin [Streptococcus thermophilus]MCE2339349.1 thiazolylpeptide-type bacteriocin [Streptococcus thermophilus]MCE2342450.1 thiazolylpeptide-type bacteriocin [Streptococcus thermophilus]